MRLWDLPKEWPLREPAYLRPALSLTLSDIFSFAVGNCDEALVPVIAEPKLYPNPLVRGQSLHLKGSEGIKSIELFNLKGQKVLHTELSTGKNERVINLPVENLPKGVYILKFKGYLRSFKTQKFVLL